MSLSKTIAVQLGYFEGIHTDLVWPCFLKNLKARGYNVLFFPGRSLRSPIPLDYQFNRIYNFIHPGTVDGIIFTAGIDHFTSKEEQRQIFREFGSIPMVSMGACLPDIPSITVSNRMGTRGAVDHLYHEHGRRNIAFLCGPGESTEAIERRAGYLDFFEANGLGVDPSMMVEGLDFSQESGTAGVVELLDGNQCELDGLVCSNDDQALAAYDELTRRGIRVPEDVSLVGFDDIRTLKANRVGLSSVHQPLETMVIKTVEVMDGMLKGKPVEDHYEIPLEISLRSSCGCFSEHMNDLYPMSIPREESKVMPPFPKEKLLRHFTQSSEGEALLTLLERWMKQLMETSDFPGDSSHILDELNRGLNQESLDILGVRNWHHFFNVILEWVYSCPMPNQDFRGFCAFFQRVRILITDKQAIQENLKLEKGVAYNEILRILSQRFIFTSDFSQIEFALKETFRGVGVDSIHLMLFEGDIEDGREFYLSLPKYARPVISIYPRGVKNPSKRRFLSRNMFNEAMKNSEGFQYIIQPLFHTEEMLGYMLIQPGPEAGAFYSNLVYLLSSAMKSVVLYKSQLKYQKQLKNTLKELEKSNEKLTEQNRVDSLTGLYNRRGFYSRAEQNLALIRRMNTRALIFYGDMDGLKIINDTLGHQAGDQAIKGAAWALNQTFRSSDIIARFGGDEFVVMSIGVEEDNLKDIFTRLEDNLNIQNKKLKSFKISLSLGYVYVDPQDPNVAIDELLHRADSELYEKKKEKRGKRRSLVGLE